MIRYDDVFTYENLLKAYHHCRKGKRTRRNVIDYEVSITRNLMKLYHDLNNRNYKIGNLYQFEIYEPKHRDVVANCFADKIVQRIICQEILLPAISPLLIFDNYATQPGKGTDLARNRFGEFLKRYYRYNKTNHGYILRCDISKYFGTIDRQILFNMIKKLNIDDDCKNIIKTQIYSYQPDSPIGVCIGFQTVQWLAVYYLNGLDHYIKEQLHIKFYGRYMDDFYLIHPDKEYLKYCLFEIQNYLSTLNIRLNDKTEIHKLSEPTNWLGFHYRLDDSSKVTIRITKQSVRRYIKRIRRFKKLFDQDRISSDTIEQSFASVTDHVSKATE